MSDKKNPFTHMTPEQLQQAWRKTSQLQPMVSQWIEQTPRAMLTSHPPAGHVQPQLEMDLRQKAEVQTVLNDPSLTVEDKVGLMVMLIMGQMDKEIETQAALVKAKTTAPATARDPSINRYNQTATNIIQNIGR
jgi:hypothetical protein